MSEFDLELRMAVYQQFARTGGSPTLDMMRQLLGASDEDITEGYRRLHARRLLVPADDFTSIRMAPPFSGVPTQHRVRVNDIEYFANCAWDAFGVPAALGVDGHVSSTCPDCGDRLEVDVRAGVPTRDDLVAHFLLPASRWWEDIVFT